MEEERKRRRRRRRRPRASEPAAVSAAVKTAGTQASAATAKAPAVHAPTLCAICGKPIESGSTVDHVVPQAIYKWNERYLARAEFNDLRRRITSPRNTVRTHRYCNERKEESIISVDSLHVSRTKRAKLRATFTAVKPYIEGFLENKAKLLDAQEHCCYICHAPLKGGVLRRIDDTLERTWDNACLICHRCNCKVKSKDVKTYRQLRKTAAAGHRRRSRRSRSHGADIRPGTNTSSGAGTPPGTNTSSGG